MCIFKIKSNFISQMFIGKHPGSFHSHSALNIPSRLSENARSLLCDVSLHFVALFNVNLWI